jgi:predicted HTH domain antitoxin
MAELAEKSQELEAHLQHRAINIADEYDDEEVVDEIHPSERIC